MNSKRGLVALIVIGIIALGGLAFWLAKGGSNSVGNYWSTLTGSYVAKVNGDVITNKELDQWVGIGKKSEESQGADFSDPKALTEYRKYMLSQLIESKLILQEVKKRNLMPTTAEVEAKIKQVKDQNLGGDEAKYQDFLKAQGITEDFFRELALNTLAHDKLLEAVGGEPTVTEDMIKNYYAENKEQFMAFPQVQVAHILLKTEDEAKQVIQQLENKGDFEQLAVQKSVDPTAKETKGQLGYRVKDELDSMISPEFGAAAFSLKKGDFSKVPVKSPSGYHVIRVTDIKTGEYEDVKQFIKDELVRLLKNGNFTNYLKDVRSKSQIENKLGDPEPPAGQESSTPSAPPQ